MSVNAQESGKKWIQASVAVLCIILGYVFISFFETMSEWFELEAKISNYTLISQALSVVLAGSIFVFIIKNEKTSRFLSEVFYETLKVVWPDKGQTVRHTVGIMIGVTIVGFILGFFDFISTWALSLIN